MLLPPTVLKPRAAAPLAKSPLKRRQLLLAAVFSTSLLALPVAALAAPVALSAADKALVAQVEAYLNAQKGLTANFLQVAADGSTRTGKAWLQRPGKMRFAYDPPDPQLLVAGFGVLTYVDPDLNQTSNIPVSATPLGILLDKHVDLEGPNVYVSSINKQPGEVDLTLVRRGKEQAGSLTLSFATDPLELRQWIVTDAQGRQTSVHLYDIAPAGPFPDSMFQYTPTSPSIPTGG